MTYAEIIEDSITPAGHRLTTMEVCFHRFVLAEFNTHRVFSRNSASSRAIPVAKQVERVLDDPAIPVKWPAEKRGMQGGDEIDDIQGAVDRWRSARIDAVDSVRVLAYELGVHKSVANRLLEPFMWHTVVVTSTAWENFFAQRVSPLAQPEIHQAAEMMREAYDGHNPMELEFGEWHLPYTTLEDWEEIESRGVSTSEAMIGMRQISSARCARVSYMTHDGERDIDKDLNLYNRLVSADPPHWSPLEHVAVADVWNVRNLNLPSRGEDGQIVFEGTYNTASVELPKVGNFVGWTQQRFLVEQQQGVNTYA